MIVKYHYLVMEQIAGVRTRIYLSCDLSYDISHYIWFGYVNNGLFLRYV